MYKEIILTACFFLACYHVVMMYFLLKKVSNRHECKCVVKPIESKKDYNYANILKRRQKFRSDAGWYHQEIKQREHEQNQ